MFKRIVIGIISFVLAATMLCGCTFFGHDNERDMQQVVAHVEAYNITNSVRNEDGTVMDVTYDAPAKDIYKFDLYEYVRTNQSSLASSFSDAESLYRYALSMLVNIEIISNEVEALIKAGKIEWGLTETNAVKKRVYSLIDSALMTIKNEILASRDRPEISSDGDSEVSTDTTYPVKPEETDDEEDKEQGKDTEEWEPALSRYPGLAGDNDRRSLEREAMRRFISLLKNRVKDDFRVTDEDREKFDKDGESIDEIINTKGIEYVYPMIGSTHLMYYISGKSLERSQKISALQEYLTDSATVDDAEVERAYTAKLNEQVSSFTSDIANFDTAMSGDSTVLYYPNNNYFYVKHILLPFSDEQKAELTAYKSRIDVSEDQVEAFRGRLAESIVCYPHVAGENDMSRPMSVDDVLAEVKAKMLPLAANVKRADVAFDDLIYLYNTDPGAFGNNKGYVVKYKLADGESETYMKEFATAARYMRDNLGVGQVYYEKVITDYGVHIMYFASTTKVGKVGLDDYTTPGEVETYFDVLKAPIKTARENAAYDTWEKRVLSYNYNKHATLYEDRASSFWK